MIKIKALRYTLWANKLGTKKRDRQSDWPQFCAWLAQLPPVHVKNDCQLIKLAIFGDEPTERGSLRHDKNVLGVTGIEGDYDGQKTTPEAAIELLERHNLKACIAPTFSSTPEKPRWRVLTPLSDGVPPDERLRYIEMLNGMLGGILAPESATLSQSYYVGVPTNSPYTVLTTFNDPAAGVTLDALDVERVPLRREKEKKVTSRNKTIKYDRLSDKTKALIADGLGDHPSRSEAVAAVACAMVRARYSDDEINATLTDPQHGVSEKALEKYDPTRWLLQHVIEPARDEVGVISISEIMARANALTKDSPPAEINKLLLEISAPPLDPITLKSLLAVIKKNTGMGLADLKAGLRALKDTADDLGLTVAKRTLEAYYANGAHLIRATDRNFWAYTKTHWQRINDDQLRNKILAIVEKIVTPGERDFSAVVTSAFNLLIARQAAAGDVMRLTGEPPPVINCKNGELWIDERGTVDLRPHSADSFLTYVLNVTYDPKARCPKFDRALVGIFWHSGSAAGMARHFMEMFGYAIQPQRDVAAWFMLRGPGSNGKTRLMQTIEALVNKDAIFADRIDDIERDRFKRGALAGKLILLDDDVDTGTKLPDGFLKSISERKLLSGQHKFKDSFDFVACCLPILLANNYPNSADLSHGMRRRARIIPFDRIFHRDAATARKAGDPAAVADPKLFPYIWRHELPGVLNRAIEGLQRLRIRGDFEDPHACIEAQKIWLASANPLAAFVSEGCIEDATRAVLIRDFYTAFVEWAGECGIRSLPARNTVKANLENLGYTVARSSFGNEVRGLYLRDEF